MERIYDEKENRKPQPRCYSSGFGLGIILIVAGVVFLSSNLGLIDPIVKSIVISWQSLLIVLGLLNLAKRQYISGTVLIMVGGFFMIPKLIYLLPWYFPRMDPDFARLYWPFLLIAVGIVVLFVRNRQYHWHVEHWEQWEHKRRRCSKEHHGPREEVRNGSGYYEKNAVFGGAELIVLDPEFHGGDFNSVFGEIVIDLRNTTIPEGDTVIEANTVFGGINIYVPEDWVVIPNINSVFGGFDDKRPQVPAKDSSRRLIVECSCVFGGGEIRS